MNDRYSKLLLQIVFIILTISMITLSSQVSSASDAEFEFDPFRDIRRTILDHDGNLIIVGETSGDDIAIVKIDSNGIVIWDQVFGGSEKEEADDLVIDKNNNIYLLGLTSSSDFSVTENAFQKEYGGNGDLFIRIISPDGEVLLSSYWGGSKTEQLYPWTNPLIITSDNKLIMLGETKSDDIEMIDAFQPDYILKEGGLGPRGNWMITKISLDGTVEWSSYFGASGEVFVLVKLDADDNIILYGDVQGVGLPGVKNEQFQFCGVRDEFISKISPSGEIIFTKYLGGSSEEWAGISFEIDGQNNIYTRGLTSSSDYDTSENAFQPNYAGDGDLFINKISPDGDILWSSYFGGSSDDNVGTCCFEEADDNKIPSIGLFFLDSNDDIVITAISSSSDLPLINAYDNSTDGNSAYLAKISSDGTSIVFGTYLKGWVSDVLINQNNEIAITGFTTSADLKTTANAAQANFGGGVDGYYLSLFANGSVQYSSYLGGSGNDKVVEGILTVDGKLLIIGTTSSNDLPNALNTFGGDEDIFVCSIDQIGSIEFCRYIGGEARDVINRAGILVDDLGNIILMGITRSQDLDLTNPPSTSYDKTALISQINEDGIEQWIEVYIPRGEEIAKDDPNNTLLYLIIGSVIASLTLGGFYLRSLYLKSRTLDNRLLNVNMREILSPIFNSQPQLIHIFGATKIFKENKINNEIVSDLPKEILDFKYFLHPIRLSMVKLLDENVYLTTVQIKNFLGIGWNEVQFHLESLKKAKYITINQQFIDGITKTVVTAESKVISQYRALKDILLEFLDATPNLDKYLEHVTEVKMRSEEQDLYPNNQ